MDFKCPYCKYPLSGTPDVCPLCHKTLSYMVLGNDGDGASSASPTVINIQNSAVEAPHTGLDGVSFAASTPSAAPSAPAPGIAPIPAPSAPAAPREKKPPVTAFNLFALLCNLIGIGFFVFLIFVPMFRADAHYDWMEWIENALGKPFPTNTPFSLMEYLFIFILSFIKLISQGFDIQLLLKLVQVVPILIIGIVDAIFLIGAFFNVLINIVNLFGKKLPKYVRKSNATIEQIYKEPFNLLGVAIATSIIFALFVYLPYLLSLIPFLNGNEFIEMMFDSALYDSLTVTVIEGVDMILMFYVTFAILLLFIIFSIVKKALRSKVNPR